MPTNANAYICPTDWWQKTHVIIHNLEPAIKTNSLIMEFFDSNGRVNLHEHEFYHFDFIIPICCNLSPFSQYIFLLISSFEVRVSAGAR